MKILFLGTPEFASEHLEYLIKNKFEIVAAISQPDKPKGRGKKLLPTPVKQVALKYNIPIFQPQKLNKEGLKIIEEFKPDIGIVVAYGKLLKPPFLDAIPFFNIHASLLPKYRGAAPIQRALENGESRTGITIFKIGIGMDDGPIAIQREIEVGEYETFGDLYEKLLNLGKKTLIEFLNKYPMELIPQSGEPTFAPKITNEDLIIDFNVAESIICTGINNYKMVPVLKLNYRDRNQKRNYFYGKISSNPNLKWFLRLTENETAVATTMTNMFGDFRFGGVEDGNYVLNIYNPININFKDSEIGAISLPDTPTATKMINVPDDNGIDIVIE